MALCYKLRWCLHRRGGTCLKKKWITTAIPERVYALCKIVEKGPISLSELKDKMEPEFLGNGSVYFNDYKNAAQELELFLFLMIRYSWRLILK